MKIGKFSIDDWEFELNQMGNPSWYRACHGNLYRQEGLTARCSDITIYNDMPHHPWHLSFQHNIFKKEYFIMYGDNAPLVFANAIVGKSAVDLFLDKLSKLKVFL
jgi:hypothetical protein